MKTFITILLLAFSGLIYAQSYSYLGAYTSNGTPLYLEQPGDIVSNATLDLIGGALPEGYPVPDYNPHYITSGFDTDIKIQANADVWVTFVQEGAGYRNVLGFYTYDSNNPPSTVPADEDITIIFPNVSALGSGGGLQTGDKVKIGSFTAGTSIGWVLLANAWNGSRVTRGQWQLYSNSYLNPESDPNLQQHNVLLEDVENQRIILGFEDIRRDYGSCDNDFNDAIFYVTANPYTAIKSGNLTNVESATDVTSANEGGLESNGTLAEKIALRNYTRVINNTGKNNIHQQTRFSKEGMLSHKSAAMGDLDSYIPQSGMFGTETSYISSPEDLLSITNAEKILSVDYYQNEQRVSAVFATATTGAVYDHTKVICDRLNSSQLKDIRTVTVRGHQLISTEIRRANGELEKSVSFSIKKGDIANELYSYWSLNNYPEGDYYNFQIWGSSFSQVFALTNQVLDAFAAQKDLLPDSSTQKIPEVFVTSGYYANGALNLSVVNKTGTRHVEIDYNIAPSESKERVQKSETVELSGNWNDTLKIETGSLFDVGLSIYAPGTNQFDALYLADGPWGVDYQEEETVLENVEIDNATPVFNSQNFHLERQPRISGQVKGTVNLFRQVLPGHQSLDVSGYHALEFTLKSTHPVEVILVTDGLVDWNNRLRYTIGASLSETTHAVALTDFVDGNQQQGNLAKVNRIVFSVQGNYTTFSPFSVELSNVAFSNQVTTGVLGVAAKAAMQVRNYPNPFQTHTDILLPQSTDQVHIKVFSLTGELVDEQQLSKSGNNRYAYKQTNLVQGMYTYRISDENGQVSHGTFLITR